MDPVDEGPVAKFFRARFKAELLSAEPVSIQLLVEIWASRSPAHNQKLGHAALSRSRHTGREKFATGPSTAPGAAEMVALGAVEGFPLDGSKCFHTGGWLWYGNTYEQRTRTR
jgi:hypothetical protein